MVELIVTGVGELEKRLESKSFLGELPYHLTLYTIRIGSVWFPIIL